MSGQAPVNNFRFLPKLTGDLGKGREALSRLREPLGLSSSRDHAQPRSFPIKFAQVAHRFGQWREDWGAVAGSRHFPPTTEFN